MLRSAATAANLLRCASAASSTAPAATSIAGVRSFAMGGVPEHWGKPSEYTEGTNFLGTPKDHMELVAKRPLSPDVFTLDNKGFHYKMPWGAVSSIANRATGVALSVGFAGAGYVALTGDLPGALAALKANYPVTTFFCKAAITFPLVYHFAGGMRHVVWDQHKIGKQADHHSLLETPAVEKSSQAILAGSAALALILAML